MLALLQGRNLLGHLPGPVEVGQHKHDRMEAGAPRRWRRIGPGCLNGLSSSSRASAGLLAATARAIPAKAVARAAGVGSCAATSTAWATVAGGVAPAAVRISPIACAATSARGCRVTWRSASSGRLQQRQRHESIDGQRAHPRRRAGVGQQHLEHGGPAAGSSIAA